MSIVVTCEELEDLLENYGDMVYRIAYQFMGNTMDAEDMMQDTFMKLVQKERKFKSEEHLKAWLIRVTSNVCKDELKASWRKKQVEYTEDQRSYKVEEQGVLQEVMELPPNYRIVIYLHYYEGYSVEEIGKFLGKTSGTVKTWMRRGREKLKLVLGGENHE